MISGKRSLAIYRDLFDGTQLSDCPLPCTTTNTETKHLFYRTSVRNYSTILLTFSSKVLVTRTDFPEFSLASFLSEVGGSMGLWLGLGMVQVMELVINSILQRITQNIAT